MKNKYSKSNIKILLTIILLMSVIMVYDKSVLANGGPGIMKDLIIGGNAYYEEVEDVYLKSEDLSIDVNKDIINVNVEYILSNEGAAKEINYIFPVTRFKRYDGGEIKHIEIYDNNDKLEYVKTQSVQEMTESDYNNVEEKYDCYIRDFTEQKEDTYYTTTINFKEKETKKISVRYSVTGQYDSAYSSKSYLEYYSSTSFFYDLTPASYWGDGLVGEFKLNIDYKDILICDDINVNIPEFKYDRLKGTFEYTATDFDFKKQDSIIITYDYPYQIEELEKNRVINDCVDSIYVSSSLESQGKYSYTPDKMFDNNLDTAWVEGNEGVGIGDYIEVLFENSATRKLGIINGYIQSRETYYNNARIKKAKIEMINRVDLKEYNDLDTMDEYNKNEFIQEFKDIPYEAIDKNNYYNNIELIGWYSLDGYGTLGQYIRITILEVYEGLKYDDLAISEAFVFDADYSCDYDDIEYKKGYDIRSTPIYKSSTVKKTRQNEESTTDNEIQDDDTEDYNKVEESNEEFIDEKNEKETKDKNLKKGNLNDITNENKTVEAITDNVNNKTNPGDETGNDLEGNQINNRSSSTNYIIIILIGTAIMNAIFLIFIYRKKKQ